MSRIINITLPERTFQITIPEQHATVTIDFPEKTIDAVIPAQTMTVTMTTPEPVWTIDGVKSIRMQASSTLDESRIDSRLDCFKRAGVNRIELHTHFAYNGPPAFYQSNIMESRDFDSLAYVLNKAHGQNIEVYALFTAGYLGWANNQHPEWNCKNVYSDNVDDQYLHNWLDFANPDARQFVADVVAEVVQNYDVDGILMDATRWRRDFIKRAGLNADSITETMRLIREATDNIRPIPITASPSADHGYAVEWWGQNWFYWLEKGYIDFATPLSYVTRKELLDRWLGEWRDHDWFPDYAIPRLPLAWFDPEKPKSIAEILDWNHHCYELGARGLSLWDDRYLCTNKIPGLIEALADGGW